MSSDLGTSLVLGGVNVRNRVLAEEFYRSQLSSFSCSYNEYNAIALQLKALRDQHDQFKQQLYQQLPTLTSTTTTTLSPSIGKSQQTVSLLPFDDPQEPMSSLDNVIIPRRANEGIRGIFDRPELHESMKNRMEHEFKIHYGIDTLTTPTINNLGKSTSKAHCSSPMPATLVSTVKAVKKTTKSTTIASSSSQRKMSKFHKSSVSEVTKIKKERASPVKHERPKTREKRRDETDNNPVVKIRRDKWPPKVDVKPIKKQVPKPSSRKTACRLEEDRVLHIKWHRRGINLATADVDRMMSKALFRHFSSVDDKVKLRYVERDRSRPFDTWLFYSSTHDAMRAYRAIKQSPKVFWFNHKFRDEQFTYLVDFPRLKN